MAESATATKGLARRRSVAGNLAPFLAKYGVILAMIGTFVAFSVARPDSFFTQTTLKAIARDGAPLLIIALGVTVVLVMNEFDLSIAGMLGLVGTFTVLLVSSEHFGFPIGLAVLVGLAFGASLGLWNGVLVAYAGASSFIVTIAMGTFYQGLDLFLLDQQTIFEGIPGTFKKVAGGIWPSGGLSHQVFVALGVLIAIYLFLGHSGAGRYMYAIGGNPEAARLSGVRVQRIRALGFSIVGLCVAVAAILVTSQAGAANPNSGLGFLLPAYAAAFLGSTMWRPGVFTAFGTLLGAIFLQIIGTGLLLFNLTSAVVLMIQGGILVAAVLLSRLGRA